MELNGDVAGDGGQESLLQFGDCGRHAITVRLENVGIAFLEQLGQRLAEGCVLAEIPEQLAGFIVVIAAALYKDCDDRDMVLQRTVRLC